MSFYGSIYYQLVDAFNRLWFSNQGKDSIIFPGEDKLVNPNPAEGVPEDTFEYHSPGRQGVIDLKSGNRWVVFTQNEEDKSFKIWHREADTESNVPGNGFYHIPNMYLVIQQDGEKIEEVITRGVQETTERITEEGGTFVLEEGCRMVVEIPSETGDPSYAIYKYNLNGEWEEELAATQDMVTILSPDDFFVTTESYAVDGAGHMIPGARHLYKMPKSDVQEEIDALKARMTKNEEHDGEQDDDIDLLEEYVGDWSLYRGATSDKNYNYWMPGVSDAIGDMCELIAGHKNTFKEDGSPKDIWSDWEDNRDVTIARVIGNLTELRDDLKTNDNAYFNINDETKLSDISIIDLILYLKNSLIANNTTTITGHTGQLINLTSDVNRLDDENNTQDDRLLSLENRATDLEAEDVKIYQKIADEKLLLEAEDRRLDGRIDDVSKAVSDHAIASEQAHTQLNNAITTLNNTLTQKIENDIATESGIINGRITSEVETINGKFDAIHNSETGILANANKYTDELAEGAVKNNTDAITAINDGESGILKSANNYADAEIDALNYTDSNAADGQYVYSVNEANGIIAVEHKALPTYTLTSGSTNGTVAFNGSDVIVKGLGTAAYSNTDAFDAAGAAATAKTEAIAEAGNLIQALSAEGGAIQVNAKAIEGLQELLKDYGDLVAKVAELEQRIIALEPLPPEEPEPEPDPEPTPDEGTDDPETT